MMTTPPLTFLGPLTSPLDSRFPSLVGLIQLLRPLTCTIATIFTFLGAYLSDSRLSLSYPSLIAATVVWLVAAFGFAINDYKDVEADRYGKPHRPIPAGRLSEQAALSVAVVLAGLAVLISMGLGIGSVGYATGGLALCAAYSYRLKNTVLLGNLTVACLDGAAVLYGSFAIGSPTPAVYLVSGLVLLYIFGQEILHTTADLEGDKQAGLSTIATVMGKGLSLWTYQAITVVFLVLSLLPWVWHWVGEGYLYAVLICSIIPATSAVCLLSWNPTEKNIYIAQWITKIIWFSSIIPTVMLRA